MHVRWGIYFFAYLGSHGAGECVSAVPEAHRREERPGLVESEVAVGHVADVADVGGHHSVLEQS